MAVKVRGGIVVMDDGGDVGADLVERVSGIFPNVYRMRADRGSDAEEAVLSVGKHFDVKTCVNKLPENEAYWAVVPNDQDPVVVISDFLSAARTHLAHGYPMMGLISGHPGQRYRKLAVVVDVAQPVTTGSLALAAVGMAWRSGASLDVLMLGADPGQELTFESTRGMVEVRDEAEYYKMAIEKAEEIGLALHYVPLGESTARDQLVLDAVREGGYDLVLDDLRPIDVGPRIGRLNRVRQQLIEGESIDTAYRLMRDAPCDVALILDAVRMNLVPANYVKAGAVAALSLGVIGVASLPSSAAAASAQTDAAEAPLNPGEEVESTNTMTEVDDSAAAAATAEAQDQAAEAAAAATGVAAPPSAEIIPEEVSAEEMAQVDAAVASQEAALQAEQNELAALQQEQATADQAVASAQSDVQIARQDLAAAQATADSAYEALQYAQSGHNDLTQAEEDQALGSYNKAEKAVQDAQKVVEQANANLNVLEEQAELAAERAADQQAVVAAQQANVAGWTTFQSTADEYTQQIVAPVPGHETVTTHYGESGSMWSSGYHTGSDFAAPEGTEIVSVMDGTVVQTGYAGPYGNQTVIQNEDGTVATYSHQSDIYVEVGQQVEAGEAIGAVGSTGNSSGPHLHFEVFDSSGNRLDPEEWLGTAVNS